MSVRRAAAALALVLACAAAPAGAASLRIGLQDDPDSLDPALNWSFVGRHVLQSLCDKLVDIDADQKLVPMLATAWHWSDDGKTLTMDLRDGVKFQDGTPFDAAAVKFNIERELTLPGSRRKSEIEVVQSVEATAPLTVVMHLSKPSVPLVAAFADRPGMMVSPKAAAAADFAQHPVCAGPYRFVERVVQDHITLERDPNHWRASAYGFDRLTFVPITDATVRLTNLRSGQLDLIEQVLPTDMATVKADQTLQTMQATGLGYVGITFNIANGPKAGSPAGKSAAVRRAISLAIDRDAINQVAYDGRFLPGNQPFPPGSPYYDTSHPVPKRDLAAAKAALAAAGVGPVTIDLMISTDPVRGQTGQMIQAMLAEAGITVNLQQTEFVTLLDRARHGDFQADLLAWSGRVDPDLNISPLLACGAAGNDGHFCSQDLDAALAAGQATPDPALRKAAYAKAVAILQDQQPIVYLLHPLWLYAAKAKLHGFKPLADGIIRLDGVTMAP